MFQRLRRMAARGLLAAVVIAGLVAGAGVTALAAKPSRVGPEVAAQARALAEVAARLGFRDLDEAAWALKHIAKLHLQGLLQGRGEGRMAPNASVTRAEVLALAVRAMGLEARARELVQAGTRFDFRFADAAALRSQAWAQAYVWLAIEQGLIANAGVLQPNKAASRLWVAEILVRALGYGQAEIAAAGQQAPGFKDAKSIPADKYGYVALAVQRGLIQGYEDGTFRPQKPVTRAEMAALIDRLETLLGIELGGGARTEARVRGWLKASQGGTLTVLVPQGEAYAERSLALAAGSLVFVGDRLAMAADLRPGDRVELFLDAAGKVAFAFARFEPVELEGQVQAATAQSLTVRVTEVEVDWDEDNPVTAPSYQAGQTVTLAVYGAQVRGGGRVQAWAEGLVRPGDKVELRLHYDTVYEVRVEGRQSAEFEGVVTGKSAVAGGTQLKIRVTENDDEHPVAVDAQGVATVVVPAGAEVRLGGRPASIDAVAVGSQVEVRLEGGVVVRVTVEEEAATAKARVEITALVAAGQTAALNLKVLGDIEGTLPGRARVGDVIAVRVTPGVSVRRDGRAATVSELRVGDRGTARFRGEALVALEIDGR